MEKENDLLKRVKPECLGRLEKDNEWYQKYTSQEILEFERLTGLKVHALEVHDKDGWDDADENFTLREWENGKFQGWNYIEPESRSVIFIAPKGVGDEKILEVLTSMKNYTAYRHTKEFKEFLAEYDMDNNPDELPITDAEQLEQEQCCANHEASIENEAGVLYIRIKWYNCYCS